MTAAAGLALTTHELSALLTFNPGTSATKSMLELHLPDPSRHEGIVQAGLATLLVRDLLDLRENGDATPLGAAAIVAATLTTATAWWKVGVLGSGEASGAVYVASPTGAVLLTVRTLGIVDAFPVRADIQPVDAAIRLALQRLKDEDLVPPIAASISVSYLDSAALTVSIRTTGPGLWEIAAPAIGADALPAVKSVPEVEVADVARRLLVQTD